MNGSGETAKGGAEGARKNSQAKGPNLDDTLQSGYTHTEGATGAFRESLR